MAQAIWPWVSVFPEAPCIRQSAIPDALRTTLLDRCRRVKEAWLRARVQRMDPTRAGATTAPCVWTQAMTVRSGTQRNTMQRRAAALIGVLRLPPFNFRAVARHIFRSARPLIQQPAIR